MIKKTLLAVVAASMVTGCSIDGMSKADIGTGIGAIVGAVVGNQIGDKTAIILASGAGAFIGRMIGADLDEQDRQELAAKTMKDLDNINKGQAIDWSSSRTDSQAKVKVVDEYKEKQQVDVSALSAITVPNDMKLISKTYRAKEKSTIYTATNEQANIVGALSKNKTAQVMGITEDGKWLLVSRQSTMVGFVKAADFAYVPPKPVVAKTTQTQPVAKAPVADLDQMSSVEIQSPVAKKSMAKVINLDEVKPVNVNMTAEVECKTLDYQVTTKGSTSTTNGKACKTPGGTWNLG